MDYRAVDGGYMYDVSTSTEESQLLISSTVGLQSHHSTDVDKSDMFLSTREAVSSKNAFKRKSHPMSDLEAMTHMIKGTVGIGLLALPSAIKTAGYIVGIVGVIVLGAIATHCMWLLLHISAVLRKRHQVVALDYSETMLFAWLEVRRPRIAKIMRHVVNVFLMTTQFGFCAVYFVFIADNLSQIFCFAFSVEWPFRAWVAIILLPIVVFSWIRNLDNLSPLSYIANVCIFVGTLPILYDEVDRLVTHRAAIFMSNTTDTSTDKNNTLYPAHFDLSLALFFGSIAFTFESIGVILPLENKMRKPGHAKFVICVSMAFIVVLYTVFGLMGYLVYGNDVQSAVILNLYSTSEPIQVLFLIAKLMFVLEIFITFLLMFYVPLDFLEPLLMKLVQIKNIGKTLMLLAFRTVMVILIAVVAISVPDLNDILSLVGAVASSMLAFVFPPLMDILILWRNRAKQHWLSRLPHIIKDVLIIVIGLLGFAFGTFANLHSIVEHYIDQNNSSTMSADSECLQQKCCK